MKIPSVLSFCCVVLFGTEASRATDYSFPPNANVADYFVVKAGQKFLSIDAEGQLVFQTSAGGLITTFNPEQKDLITAANETEVTFKTSGRVSFAVFLRAQGEGGDSYMAFIGAAPDKTFILYLCKSKFSASQQPAKTALIFKHLQAYHAGDLYKLHLQLKNEGSKVVFSGELVEAQSSQPVIQISAEDTDAPLTEPGKVGFRFFADKADGGGSMEVSKISIAP